MALGEQPLSPRTWHHKRLLHGFLRSLFARPSTKQSPVQKQPQTVDTTTSAPSDNTPGSTVSGQPLMAGLLQGMTPDPGLKIPSSDDALEDMLLWSPDHGIDHDMIRFPTTRKPDKNRVWRLEGYTSDGESIQLHYKRDRTLEFRWSVSMSKLYLRDICQCSKCISPSSGQKTFSTCDIAGVPRLRDPDSESIKLSVDGDLEITWEDDFLTGGKHTSTYPLNLLTRVETFDGRLYSSPQPSRIFWNSAKFRADVESRLVSYSDWMDGGREFARAVADLYRYGLVFMRGVPESRYAVQEIAEKIGNLRSTFHGLTWDVISKPESENLAYANESLCLQQDLLYCSNVPKVQILHCLENGREGGDSLFSDGLRTAYELIVKDPRSYEVLSNQMIGFHYDKEGHYYWMDRHVIQSKPCGSPFGVAWSPPFQGPFRFSSHRKPLKSRKGHEKQRVESMFQGWSKAARAFRDGVESPENMIQYRLQPGDCVIFDNTRILHGRTRFDGTGGRRHLRGAYIDNQTLRSAFIGLYEKDLLMPEGITKESWRKEKEKSQSRLDLASHQP
ncbi:hypothetical protein J7T55_001435 [Diaporthe amygdali]|uniref:uncharacterized protein n=1 Tax=Phomopsis amygdali TaxID=1214568 RepID=UPI0022FEB511|nr:uncharacterized protein J7T55_001435 [Diaporthe amygdali]KAJ0115027.1 hypothetical protein J7T55_001435 [Diaporthe amygdali]